METIKKNIILDKKIGREVSQLLIEGDIIVPDTKPDMDRLLKKSANAYIDSREIGDERVSFKGSLDLEVLYIAKNEEKAIHSMKASTPINDFINMEGVEKDMFVSTNCSITNIEYKIVNDRKVNFRCILDVVAEVIGKEENEIVIDIEGLPESQMKKNQVSMNSLVLGKNDKFIIKEEISIPSGKPNINELLESRFSICSKEVKTSDGKVNVSGNLKILSLYKSDEDEGIIEYLENEIPFSGSLEAEGCDSSMLAEVKACVCHCSCQANSDDDGEARILEIEAEIGAELRVLKEESIDILEDSYCINKKTELDMEYMNYPVFLCKNKNQCPIKELVKLDIDCPPILQILSTSGNVHIDETRVIDDKVVIEGIIEIDMLYVTNKDEAPLYCFSTMLPFKQGVEAKGADDKKRLVINITSGIEHIGVNMLSDSEVEVRCVMNFDLLVREEKKLGVIYDIEFTPIAEEILNSIAGMTLYVVQKDDTLWKIAKKYNTSIDDLLEVNEIENPDKINIGQRILILKKVE